MGVLARRASSKDEYEVYRWHDIQYLLDIIEEQNVELDNRAQTIRALDSTIDSLK